MNLFSFELSIPTQLYLASVAVASLVVAGLALTVDRWWQTSPLPLRHAILASALAVALASPLILGAMAASGLAMFPISTQSDTPLPSVAQLNLETLPTVPLAAPAPISTNKASDSKPQVVAPIVASAPLKAIESNPVRQAARWSWLDVGRVMSLVWGAGCAVSLCALGSGLLRVRRLTTECLPLIEPRVQSLAADVARELGLKRVPVLCASERVVAPLSLGILRPRVIVPADATAALSDSQLRGLLAHEMGHVVRRDHLVGLLQRLSLVMYWWNPLVHRASAALSAVREQICDDLAARDDATVDSYAAMLVELASRAAFGRPLPATIGMFDGSRREFSRRVERLLDENRSTATQLDRRMKLVSGVVCCVLLMLAGATSLQLESQAAESPADVGQTSESAAVEIPPVKWPKLLRGTIRDEQGQPVAGAKVRLDLEKIHEFKIGRWDETLSSQEMTTGADGEYRFVASQYPEMKHRPFCLMMSVTADGFADTKTWNWYSQRDTKLDEKWQDVKLVVGRVVQGRVMTEYDVPVAGAVIKAAGDFDEYTRGWSWDPRKSDADGNFSISVPRDLEGPIELWVVSREWSPQRVVMPKRGNELADVRLGRGAKVSGRVTNEDGSPVAGVVVKAESVDDGTFNGITFPVNLAAKTGADGKYELPPMSGIYKLYLSQAEESDDRLTGRFVVAAGPLPLAAPVKVAVSGGETQKIDFQAGPGLTVSGTIRWADGRPVADCEVKASFMPASFGTGIWIDMVHTDAGGRYELRLPKPIDDVSINVAGEYDAKRVWHYATPTDDAPVERKQVQFANLNPLRENLAGVDWVLKREEDIPELQPVAEVTKTPAAEELSSLERRYELLRQELSEALDQAKTLEERSELQLTRDPRVQMADEYLAFEEQHRGTDVGLAALVKLNQLAGSVGDAMPKLSEARRELYNRLGEYYLQHPDLDLAFKNISAEPQSAEELEVIAQAIEKSPHESVQAGAICQLTCYHADQADRAATKPEQDGFDPAATQAKAMELARRLETEFADVREPERIFNESGLFWRRPDTSETASKPNYGALAKGLIFDLENLQIGLPAPDISIEKGGKREYATQYLGKVTVIVFEHSFFSGARTQSIADWAKSLSDKPLDVLVVRGKYPGDPDEFDDSALAPLRFVTEDHLGPIAMQWSIRRRPTVFVVDGNGVIRARRLSDVPYHLVSELLKGAAPQ